MELGEVGSEGRVLERAASSRRGGSPIPRVVVGAKPPYLLYPRALPFLCGVGVVAPPGSAVGSVPPRSGVISR